MTRFSTLKIRVNEYLTYRRSLGFELATEGRMLHQFAAFADGIGHRGPVTTDLAVRWARSVARPNPLYEARRLEVVRGLARYLAATEPGTEIPPQRLLGPAHRRTPPYIYSAEQIDRLMVAAGQLGPPNTLRPQTYQTLIGLLAACGLRISEALRLLRTEADLVRGRLLIRETKFRKTRWVPLRPTTMAALRSYATQRDRLTPTDHERRFFVSNCGLALPYSTVRTVFRKLCRCCGITRPGRRPRLHDLRHTFACRCVEAWYEAGADLPRLVPMLSVYLGHGKVTDTYWYLTATPELLAQAVTRFEQFVHPQIQEVEP